MRVYLATAALDEIVGPERAGLIDGIVATPAVLAAEMPHADPREVIAELASRTGLTIFASAPAIGGEEIQRGGKALARLGEHVVLAVPCVEDALPALRRLTADGVPCAATLVHSVAQGLLAAKAGARHVVIPVDALEAVGEPVDATIRGLRAAFDRYAIDCDVVAAGPSSQARLAEVVAAGADAVVVTPPLLRAFLQHPLTDRGLDRFLQDVSRRARPRRAR